MADLTDAISQNQPISEALESQVIAEDQLGNVAVETSRFTVAGPCELTRLITLLDQVRQDELIFHAGTYRELKSRLDVTQ